MSLLAYFAKVLISRPAKKLNSPFTYKVPAEFGQIPVGTRVRVPLGPTLEEGIILGYENTSFDENSLSYKLRSIKAVLDVEPWFTPEMLSTAKHLSEYYLCSYAEALSLFTIDKKKDKSYDRPKEDWLIAMPELSVEDFTKPKRKQRELAAYLLEKSEASIEQLLQAGFSRLVINQVKAATHVMVEQRYKNTRTRYAEVTKALEIPVTEAQRSCVEPINYSIKHKISKTFLLHGITGSGKTQIYIKATQECIENDRIAVVLVPEIILTNQIVQRFVAAFGDEVVVFHSKLTISERYNNWERLRRKDSHIIIGARSAVFAPTDDIGLIILDEEHENSYKQEDMLRYHAREVAKWRCKSNHCPLVLGSATPTIVSYHKALAGEYTLLELPHRIFEQPLPQVKIIDMKEELFYGNRSVFSDALRDLLKQVLAQKKQAIILLNRRGYSTFIMCRDCGEVIKCPHCDTSMVYHQADEKLRCHYCEHQEPIPTICPHCGSQKIKFFGSGTQKVEETLRTEFPTARIARLDQDIASKKGRSEEVLEGFKCGDYDILLGTQMVSKGHDFPNVTGVGILTADSVLHIPLYTASERTFNLLTQTAGRAGRGNLPGNVVIQTYNPLHYAIIKSKDHDYIGFYQEEIKARKELGYPPFGELVHLTVQHKDVKKANDIAFKIVEDLESHVDVMTTQIFGPYDEGIKRVRDLHRVSIMLRGNCLKELKGYILDSWIFTQEGLLIDVDPI